MAEIARTLKVWHDFIFRDLKHCCKKPGERCERMRTLKNGVRSQIKALLVLCFSGFANSENADLTI